MGQELSEDRESYISHTYSMQTVSEYIEGKRCVYLYVCVSVRVKLYHLQ